MPQKKSLTQEQNYEPWINNEEVKSAKDNLKQTWEMWQREGKIEDRIKWEKSRKNLQQICSDMKSKDIKQKIKEGKEHHSRGLWSQLFQAYICATCNGPINCNSTEILIFKCKKHRSIVIFEKYV